MISEYPVPDSRWIDGAVEREMGFVQSCINSIRNIRGELSIPPSKDISLVLRFEEKEKSGVLKKYEGYFHRLARVVAIETTDSGTRPPHSASAVVEGGEIFIPLGGIIDLSKERRRIEKELLHVNGMHENTQKKLSNRSFTSRAPAEIVDQERRKLDNFQKTLEKLRRNLESL